MQGFFTTNFEIICFTFCPLIFIKYNSFYQKRYSNDTKHAVLNIALFRKIRHTEENEELKNE